MIKTRFAPEPNGYLHLGHLKSMHLNFGFASKYQGACILRLDDTNPETENQEYVDKIIEAVNWMGYKFFKITYTSDYFDELHNFAIVLIKSGNAYMDDLDENTLSEYRRKNMDSPNRNKTIEENLQLFKEMGNGKRPNVYLRGKIDMPDNKNWNKIDPIFYRIKAAPHYRHGNKYNIYPSYDFSHCIVDSIEGITHSFCTSEFYIRRIIYYWVLDKLGLKKPIVDETNRLRLNDAITSKRKIKRLIEKSRINGWDDPRILTIMGLKNRGYNPEMLKSFLDKISYTKNDNAIIPIELFHQCIRDYLDKNADRCFCIQNPLKVFITNIENNEAISLTRPNHPYYPDRGSRMMSIGREIFIEKEDFKLDVNNKYNRLTRSNPVRLKYFGIVKYVGHEVDENGNIISISVEKVNDCVKVRGTIHWLHEFDVAEVNYFDNNIFCKDAIIEKNLEKDYYQFERIGYYYRSKDGSYNHLVSLKENKYK